MYKDRTDLDHPWRPKVFKFQTWLPIQRSLERPESTFDRLLLYSELVNWKEVYEL